MKAVLLRAIVAASCLLAFVSGPAPTHAQATPGPQTQGVEYLSPKPGSDWNPTQTTIAVRYGDQLDASDLGAIAFTVSGSSSGRHSGSVVLSDDQETLIFKPDQPFSTQETVTVTVPAWTSTPAGTTHAAVDLHFTIMPDGGAPLASTTGSLITQQSAPPTPQPTDTPSVVPHYLTVPSDFPAITVTVPAAGTADGLVFASNFGLSPDPSGYYLLILDNNGQPVYYQKLAANSRALDFTELSNGTLAYSDFALNAFVILDNTYRQIDTIRPGNGYGALDEHDLQLLPNGHYLLFANEARYVDLSGTPGGSARTSVTGQIIQELDKNKNVVFQWRDLDYIPVTDTTQPLNTQLIDYSHSNAVAVDTDGNLLLSSRHLDSIVKIDRQTGDIIWTMGGKENQFTFSAAPGVAGPADFYHQHDIRALPNGHITLFDNHDGNQPQVSRALEYALDQPAKTATLVWAWQTTPAPYAEAMGNVQRLGNGNTMIGWGTNLFPNIDEVRPDGSKAFELDFGGPDVTYRAYRFPWHGFPTWAPALVAQPAGTGVSLTFSWNGATDVGSYRVYGGNTSSPSTLVATVARAGFETTLVVPQSASADCYYQVMPLDLQGNPTHASAAVRNPQATNPACAAASSSVPLSESWLGVVP